MTFADHTPSPCGAGGLITSLRPFVIASVFALSACATPARMHTDIELNDVGHQCGLEAGELMQDESEKRLLFLMRPGATVGERACVQRWARKNNLHLAVLDGLNYPAN